MKALIICSVHALCDVSGLEREACNRACALHGIPAILTAQDHDRLIASSTMLEFLTGLPGSEEQRCALVSSYLDILNESVWNASLNAYQSVQKALLDPDAFGRPTAFASDYPILTTNLVRSSALMTNATKLGVLTPEPEPHDVRCVEERLAGAAASLGVAPENVVVLVALNRDFAAARSLGMCPRFIEERAPGAMFGHSAAKKEELFPTDLIPGRRQMPEALPLSA